MPTFRNGVAFLQLEKSHSGFDNIKKEANFSLANIERHQGRVVRWCNLELVSFFFAQIGSVKLFLQS